MMTLRVTRHDGTGRAPDRAFFPVVAVAEIAVAACAPAFIRRGHAVARSAMTATGPIRE